MIALLAAAIGAAPPTDAAGATTPTTPRPVPVLVTVRLDYGGVPNGLGTSGRYVPLLPAVVAAALTDNTFLRYQRHADLGGFEPAPIGQQAATVTARALGSGPLRTQIPLYARSRAAGTQISSFAFVSSPAGPGGSATAPGSTRTTPSPGTGANIATTPNPGSSGARPGSGTGSPPPSGAPSASPEGTSGSGQVGPGAQGSSGVPPASIGAAGVPATATTSPNTDSTTTTQEMPGGASGGGRSSPPATAQTTTSVPHHVTTTTSPTTTPMAPSTTTTSLPPAVTTTVTATTTPSHTTTTGVSTNTSGGGATTTTIAGTSIAMTNSREAVDVVSATNMAPGDSVTRDVTIGNAGSLSFVLSLRSSSASTNLLASLLQLSVVQVSTAPTRTIESGGLTGSAGDIETMRPGQTTTFAVTLRLPATAGNDVQHQSASVDLLWSGQA